MVRRAQLVPLQDCPQDRAYQKMGIAQVRAGQAQRRARVVWAMAVFWRALAEALALGTSYDGMKRSEPTGQWGQSRCRARDNVSCKPGNLIS
ncbi:hypothetical protein GCM10009096_16750 [Parasphingorhabdus litoris]|uniref:Transposase n=1 Tax=Parasphingorhabdus litoris TaxID=394733 RepID=A0ABN1AG67_9SPHN